MRPPRARHKRGDDRVGSRAANLALSRRRAAAVKAYVLRGGVAEDRIRIVAHGEDRPLVQTPDGVPDPQNRFVAVIIARYCRILPGFPSRPAGRPRAAEPSLLPPRLRASPR